MKIRRILILLLILLAAPSLMAQDTPVAPVSWHARTLLQAVANVFLFALIGVFTAIVGFKLFDKCTPGHLSREIVEHRNVAAAIIGAAVILGVCIIVAAAIIG